MGVKNITGMRSAIGSVEVTKEHVNKLNLFFKRFDSSAKARPTSIPSVEVAS